MSDEVWKDISGFEGRYWASSLGRLKSVKTILMFDKSVNNAGYLYSHLGHAKKTYPVHRIIAETFVSNPENKPQVNHINGNKKDNRAINLNWMTAKENMRHMFENLSEESRAKKRESATGINNANAKMNVSDVIKIRLSKKTDAHLAMEYKVSTTCINRIRIRRTWKHVQ